MNVQTMKQVAQYLADHGFFVQECPVSTEGPGVEVELGDGRVTMVRSMDKARSLVEQEEAANGS